MNSKIFGRIYKLVCLIPKGKVTTYGEIGKVLNMSPKVVGYALHANKTDKVPCHRVVNRNGRVAPGYAFGGPEIQRKKLEKEGIKFKDELNVDLQKHMFCYLSRLSTSDFQPGRLFSLVT